MEPTYEVGDLVWSRAGTPVVGDIVRVNGRAESYVHRLEAIRPDGLYTTKGVANATPDAIPVRPQDVEVVIAHVGGTTANALRYAETWPARAAIAIAMVFLWPSRKRRDRTASARHETNLTVRDAAPVAVEHVPHDAAAGAPVVRRRDLRRAS